MKACGFGFLTLALVALSLASGASPASGEGKMEITSPAFNDGATIPTRHVMREAGGRNVSIPLKWKGAPQGTKCFALSIVDPHPVASNWVHWLVVNIPAGTTSLEEGASGKSMPAGAVELKSSFGDVGYGGPQPPRGSGRHPYVITIYALSTDKVEIAANANLAAFQDAIKGHVIAEGKITGYYQQ